MKVANCNQSRDMFTSMDILLQYTGVELELLYNGSHH